MLQLPRGGPHSEKLPEQEEGRESRDGGSSRDDKEGGRNGHSLAVDRCGPTDYGGGGNRYREPVPESSGSGGHGSRGIYNVTHTGSGAEDGNTHMGWTIDRHGERTENTPDGESERGSENRGGEGDGRNTSAGDERNRATIGERRIEKVQEIRDRVRRRKATSTVRGPAGGITNRGTGSDEKEDRSQ